MAEFLPTAVRIAGALEVGGALALITGCPPKVSSTTERWLPALDRCGTTGVPLRLHPVPYHVYHQPALLQHAAWMLGLFLVLITPFAHYPILADGKTVDMHHAIQILKNLSLIGACIAIYITNGGVATKAKKA